MATLEFSASFSPLQINVYSEKCPLYFVVMSSEFFAITFYFYNDVYIKKTRNRQDKINSFWEQNTAELDIISKFHIWLSL